MTSRSVSNQNSESCVSTRPLSGIGVGSTTSKADRRSVATSSRSLADLVEVAHLAAGKKLSPGKFVSQTTALILWRSQAIQSL